MRNKFENKLNFVTLREKLCGRKRSIIIQLEGPYSYYLKQIQTKKEYLLYESITVIYFTLNVNCSWRLPQIFMKCLLPEALFFIINLKRFLN